MQKKQYFCSVFRKKTKNLTIFKALKFIFGMKKMLIIVAVAFAAISCCGKCGEKKCCEHKCCQDSAAACCHADSAAVVAEEAPAAE
jgi:hypothetical protein